MAVAQKLRTPPREVFAHLAEGTRAQLIDGEVVMSPAPSSLHQLIVGKIFFRFYEYLRLVPDCGQVFVAPIDVRFSEDEIYQPDIVFITAAKREKIRDWGIDGPPEIVVEVLSEGTAYLDLNHKKKIYEQFGVREYLVVSPIERTVELWVNEAGFVSRGCLQQGGEIAFQELLGFTLAVTDIFNN